MIENKFKKTYKISQSIIYALPRIIITTNILILDFYNLLCNILLG